jgi:hypothetical protein
MGRKQPTASLDTDKAGATSPYIAPRELMFRWRCSRSSVDRIARRASFKRLLLGVGKNGLVRYLRSEVEALERQDLVEPSSNGLR